MSIEDLTKLLDAVSRLVGTVVWPSVIVFVLTRYRNSFKEFLETLSEFSLKGAGFEASAKRAKIEASAALVAAGVARQKDSVTPSATATDVKAAAKAVEAVTHQTIRRAGRAAVLWVDDRPSNNVHERQALEALGVNFVISTSTEDALAKMRNQKFDVIISDMGRPPDSRAGYTLLDKMRQSGDSTPFIIYAGSRAPEHIAESRKHGAIGCTNRPDELFNYVISALDSQSG